MERSLRTHFLDDERLVAVVPLEGDLDIFGKEDLARLLTSFADYDSVVIDLSSVGYLDSTALGCFVSLKKRMAQNGRKANVVVVGANSNITRIFKICGLDQLFPLYESLDEVRDFVSTRGN